MLATRPPVQDTEHYVAVGKSKLRQKQAAPLGLAYRGVRVSREQLGQESDHEFDDGEDDEDEDEEEFDDPDAVDVGGAEDVDEDNDGEIDSDDAFGSSDEELVQNFTFRGSSKPKEEEDEDDDDEEEEEEEDDDDDDDEEEDDDESGSDMEGVEDDKVDEQTAKAQDETRKILAEERQRMLAPISQSAKADADKGFAVRQQRRTFDALLNMRIRLQKALTAANSLHVAAKETPSTDDQTAVHDAASKALLGLLGSIQDIRQSFYVDESTAADRKRKRGNAGKELSCQDIFDQMAHVEEAALAKRRKVLDRWATRVHRPSAASGASSAASKRFLAPSGQQPLTAVLDEQLVAADRLVHRTRVPRSCAPVQAARRVTEDAEIYDDADFYQMLLKELVDQRTADTSAPGNSVPTVRWAAAAAKEAKTRKVVDRKASKGRKMRFNVHEKLQNFMAPEDRRHWEAEAVDRLFSTLFGQRTELLEDDGDEDAEMDDEVGGVGLNAGELKLF